MTETQKRKPLPAKAGASNPLECKTRNEMKIAQRARRARNSKPVAPRIAIFRNAYDTAPQTFELADFAHLAEELGLALAGHSAPDKRQLPAFSAGPYKPGTARGNAGVAEHTVLVLDVDHLADGIDPLLLKLDAGVECFIYASPSDTPTNRRVRIVAAVDRPIAPGDVRHARLAFADLLGLRPGSGVEGALDAARLFFIGQLEGTAPREHWRGEGQPVDVDALLAAPLALDWKAPRSLPATSPRKHKRTASTALVPISDDAERRIEAIAALISDEYDTQDRHEFTRALAGYLAKNDWSESQVVALVARLPTDQPEARIATARETYRQLFDGGPEPPGYHFLKERLGDQVLSDVAALVPCPLHTAWLGRVTARLCKGAANDTQALTPAKAEGAPASHDPLVDLACSRQGVPRPTQANAALILEANFRDAIRFESCAGRIVCSDMPVPGFPEGEWTEVHTTRMVEHGNRVDLHISAAMWDRAVESHAHKHAYNVLTDFLNACAAKWDGAPRVDSAMTTYWGAVDSRASRAVSRVFLLSLAARGLTPGVKVDTCPVLIGKQGLGKSRSLRALAGAGWFSDSPLPIGDKDGMQNTRGTWLWEFSEAVSLSRKEQNAVKAFLSSSEDRYRASYGRHVQTVPRQVCFVASSNDVEVLTDSTGGRRFLPVTVGAIDVAAVECNRIQLLGEAARRVLAGEAHWPTVAEERALEAVRADHEESDPWEETVARWLDRRGKGGAEQGFAIGDVLSDALLIPTDRHAVGLQRRAGAVLRRLGCEKRRGTERKAGARDLTRWYPPR